MGEVFMHLHEASKVWNNILSLNSGFLCLPLFSMVSHVQVQLYKYFHTWTKEGTYQWILTNIGTVPVLLNYDAKERDMRGGKIPSTAEDTTQNLSKVK